MPTFVMGDIHGAYRALKQCLERARFSYESDRLIQLGDVVDGHPEVFECIEELLKIDDLIAIKGNHDEWFNEYLQFGIHPDRWQQGGAATAKSYLRQIEKENLIIPKTNGFIVGLNPNDVPESHHDFFKRQSLYYIDDQNNLFVHAGFNRHLVFRGQSPEVYYWDRDLWLQALSFASTKRSSYHKGVFYMETKFQDIFIGHTSTTNWRTDQPMHAANLWNLDTGAGHDGRLTIMNVETEEYWQSDPVSELYGNRY